MKTNPFILAAAFIAAVPAAQSRPALTITVDDDNPETVARSPQA